MTINLRAAVACSVAASMALLLTGPAGAVEDRDAGAGELVGAALARFPQFAVLPDSRALSTPVMVQGRLTDIAGQAMSGAQVLVAAWPSNEAVHALPRGGEFDLTPVARTVAGRDGSYQLRSLITPLLSSLAGRDGLDIELDVVHGGRHYVYLTQVRLDGATWVRELANGVDGQVASALSGTALNLALDPADGDPLNQSLRAAWPPPTVGKDEPPFSDNERPFPGVTCTRYKKITDDKNAPRAMTTVATAVARNGPRIEPTYTAGAETVTSTGVSFDGGASFSINGARSRTASFEAEYVYRKAKRAKTIAREYRVEFLHNVVRRVCLVDYDNHYKVQYMTSPGRSTRGVDDVASRYASWTCRPGDGKTVRGLARSVKTTDQRAATYEAAFGFAPLGGAGFQGRALSGYSKAVEVRFRFADPQRGYWCGNTADPGADGQRLQALER